MALPVIFCFFMIDLTIKNLFCYRSTSLSKPSIKIILSSVSGLRDTLTSTTVESLTMLYKGEKAKTYFTSWVEIRLLLLTKNNLVLESVRPIQESPLLQMALGMEHNQQVLLQSRRKLQEWAVLVLLH